MSRILGWRVDGFGVLADHRVEGLPAGLTVVAGPNEAGKSTLLEFLRGVLFGFPDRRRRRPYHEPLRGGAHGGTVWLLDADGGRWLLERHVGSRSPALTAPDGTSRGEEELRRLLGGIDGEVFRSVYAFGLSELSSLETLERDEVRDLIFSAGVLGAGRSAKRAQASLADRQAILVRPRQSDAVANSLRRRLDEVDGELRRLRDEAKGYPERAAECERLAAHAHEADEAAEGLRRRLRELERLEAAWPAWRERQQAEAQLGGLPGADPAEDAVLAGASEIAALRDQRSGFVERAGQRDALARQREGILRSVEDGLVEIGPSVDPDAVRRLALGLATTERAERLSRRHGELLAEVRSMEEVAGRDAADARRLEGELAAAEAEAAGGRGVRQKVELDAAGELLHEARLALGRRDELEERRARAEREARLESLAARRGGATLASSWIVVALLAACALLAGGAALSAAGGHGAVAALVAAAALAVGATAVALVLERRREERRGDGSRDAADPSRSELERIEARLAELAETFRRPGRLERGGLELVGRALEAEAAARRELDDLARRAAEARRRREESLALADRSRAQLAEIERAAAQLRSKLMLPAGLGPDALGRGAGVLAQLRKDLEALDRVERALAENDGRLDAYAAAALTLAAELLPDGRRGPSEGAPSAVEPAGSTAAAVVASAAPRTATRPGHALAAVGHLVQRLDAATSARDARQAVGEAARRAAEAVDRALGDGDAAKRLHDEVASGDLVSWQEERQRLDARLEEAKRRHDEATRAHERASQELGELRASSRIADLELQRESLRAELGSTLERYAVFGIARALLERTLARYERERQPEVVRTAAALFASATGGRYVRLVSRLDTDGRSHGIDAIDAGGARVDAGSLSRGTAEQLYLCLRLALATKGSGGAELPLVLDDVLVNFDPDRAAAIAGLIADVAEARQVLAFTCHPHVVELLAGASANARIVELPPTGSSAR